jgi:hypothetical protein
MMEAVRTSETSINNHFTRQYNPEDSSEHQQELHNLYFSKNISIIVNKSRRMKVANGRVGGTSAGTCNVLIGEH